VADADALGALADRREEDLGRGGVAVFGEEVVFHCPDAVKADLVSERDLFERLVIDARLPAIGPRLRELQLVEQPKLHDRCSARGRPAAGIEM
jgi:hypothetical protein